MTDGSHPTSVQTSTPTAGTWWLTAHTLPQFKPPHLQPGHDWRLTPYLSSNLHTYSRDMMTEPWTWWTDGRVWAHTPAWWPQFKVWTWWLTAHTLPQFKPPHLQPGHLTEVHPTSVQTSTPTAGTWWLSHHVHGCRCGHLNWGRVWAVSHHALTPYLSSNLHTYSRDMMTDGSHPRVWAVSHVMWRFEPVSQVWRFDWGRVWASVHHLHTYSRDMMTDGSHPTSVQTSTPTAGTWWLTAHTLPQSNLHTVGVEVWTEVHPSQSIMSRLRWLEVTPLKLR